MIRVEDVGAVRTIRLDRSEKRNALTPRMLDELVAALKKAKDARVIVLEPVGPVFCAGFDLSVCRDDAGALPSLLTGLAWAAATMRASPAIVIAAAPGAAIAGGCAILCGCDIVISTPDSKFGYPVVKLGISPAVSAPLLRLAVGDGAARARMLSTDLVDGRAAYHLGLVHELVNSPEACIARAHELAARMIEKPPTGLSATKSWLGEVDGSLAGNKIKAALETSLSLVGSDEQNERLAELWKAEGAKSESKESR
ncbi:MAG: enoyl-CoA hydratase/isomerase family protein [Phycisphaerales bacterium]|nr:enoyl-CoA hydratase/isomerase family protein [Phycisphaerales bacterium]